MFEAVQKILYEQDEEEENYATEPPAPRTRQRNARRRSSTPNLPYHRAPSSALLAEYHSLMQQASHYSNPPRGLANAQTASVEAVQRKVAELKNRIMREYEAEDLYS